MMRRFAGREAGDEAYRGEVYMRLESRYAGPDAEKCVAPVAKKR